jgi:hypothetical protein
MDESTSMEGVVRFSDKYTKSTLVRWALASGLTQRQEVWSRAFMTLANYFPPESSTLKNVAEQIFRIADYVDTLRTLSQTLHRLEGTDMKEDIYFTVIHPHEGNLGFSPQTVAYKQDAAQVLQDVRQMVDANDQLSRSNALVAFLLLPLIPPSEPNADLYSTLRIKLHRIVMSPSKNQRPGLLLPAGEDAAAAAAAAAAAKGGVAAPAHQVLEQDDIDDQDMNVLHPDLDLDMDSMTMDQLRALKDLITHPEQTADGIANTMNQYLDQDDWLEVSDIDDDDVGLDLEGIRQEVASSKEHIRDSVVQIDSVFDGPLHDTPLKSTKDLEWDVDMVRRVFGSKSTDPGPACVRALEYLDQSSKRSKSLKLALEQQENLIDPQTYIFMALRLHYGVPLNKTELDTYYRYVADHQSSEELLEDSLRILPEEADGQLLSGCLFLDTVELIDSLTPYLEENLPLPTIKGYPLLSKLINDINTTDEKVQELYSEQRDQVLESRHENQFYDTLGEALDLIAKQVVDRQTHLNAENDTERLKVLIDRGLMVMLAGKLDSTIRNAQTKFLHALLRHEDVPQDKWKQVNNDVKTLGRSMGKDARMDFYLKYTWWDMFRGKNHPELNLLPEEAERFKAMGANVYNYPDDLRNPDLIMKSHFEEYKFEDEKLRQRAERLMDFYLQHMHDVFKHHTDRNDALTKGVQQQQQQPAAPDEGDVE